MKKIDFPQPVHEQAVEVLEEARKKIEALGFAVGFHTSVQWNEVRQAEDDDKNVPVVREPYSRFHIVFQANIKV